VPSFQYQARTAQGKLITGSLDASSELAVDDTLRARGLFATRIRAQNDPASKIAALRSAHPRLTPRDLTLFTMHLASVLRSGLPLSTGLRNAAEEGTNQRLRVAALALLERIEGGKLISEAMADFPDAFPEYYVNLIKAGETVGHVDDVLFDLVGSLEWQQNLKADVRQAATYPILLICMLFAVALGIAIFVMPRLVTALSRSGMELPQSAIVVVAFGEFIRTYWVQVIFGIAALFAAVRLAVDTPRGRYVTMPSSSGCRSWAASSGRSRSAGSRTTFA